MNFVLALNLVWLLNPSQATAKETPYSRLGQMLEQHGTYKEAIQYEHGSSSSDCTLKLQSISKDGIRFTEYRNYAREAWDYTVAWKDIKSVAAWQASDLLSSRSNDQSNKIFFPPVPWSEMIIDCRRPQPARHIPNLDDAATSSSENLPQISFWLDRQGNADDIRDLMIEIAKKSGAKIEKARRAPVGSIVD